LNNGLQEFIGNIIFTSHDYQIIDSVANRIIEITPNGLIDQYMSYHDYVHSEKVIELKAKMYEDAVMA